MVDSQKPQYRDVESEQDGGGVQLPAARLTLQPGVHESCTRSIQAIRGVRRISQACHRAGAPFPRASGHSPSRTYRHESGGTVLTKLPDLSPGSPRRLLIAMVKRSAVNAWTHTPASSRNTSDLFRLAANAGSWPLPFRRRFRPPFSVPPSARRRRRLRRFGFGGHGPVGNPGHCGSHDRRYPEQPKLLQRPPAHEQCRPRTPRRVHR